MRDARVLGRQRAATRRIWSGDYLAMRPLWIALRESATRARGHMLDIGCGHRPYQAWLPSTVTQYVGLDYETADASPDLVGDALRLPFPSSSFDTVLSTQTLEHLTNPFQAFDEMARVLTAGGILILTAPQSWREHEIPYDYFRFTSFGLRHLCERAGLKVTHLDAVGRAWAHVGQSFLNILLQTKLARVIAPFALIVNASTRALDAIWYDQREAINHLLIAEKTHDA